MLDWTNETILCLADALLGWLLRLPRDLALVALAAVTSLVLTLVRRWTTDQAFLRRCAADRKRLRELVREAKERGDEDALRRHRTTAGMVAGKAFRAEGRPLLWSVLPIAILAVWGVARLDYLPTRAGEDVDIVCILPISSCGEWAVMVPADGVESADGWIREIVPQALSATHVRKGLAPKGEARWTIRAEAASAPYELTIRQGSRTYEKNLLVGQPAYAPVAGSLGDDGASFCVTELKRYRPFGIVPGLASWLPPWLTGYLLLALAFVFAFRKALDIA